MNRLPLRPTALMSSNRNGRPNNLSNPGPSRSTVDDSRFAPTSVRQNNQHSQNNHYSHNFQNPRPPRPLSPALSSRSFPDREIQDRYGPSQRRPSPPRSHQMGHHNRDGERWSNNDLPQRSNYSNDDRSRQQDRDASPRARSERREEDGDRERERGRRSSPSRRKSEKRLDDVVEDRGSRTRPYEREDNRGYRDHGEGPSNGGGAIFAESVHPPQPLPRATYVRSVPVVVPSLALKESKVKVEKSSRRHSDSRYVHEQSLRGSV